MNEKLISDIVSEVLAELSEKKLTLKSAESAERPEDIQSGGNCPTTDENLVDITSKEIKAIPLLDEPEDYDALMRMKSKTSARIGVGRAGPRLKTQTLLALRADHATARDAVFFDVDQQLLDKLGLFTVQTKCSSKNEHLTRPDLGREFDPAALDVLRSKCVLKPDIQIYASDGLSSKAIEANLADILGVVTDGLKAKNLSVGTPFFVKYGRVPAMDEISEALNATVTCVFIGERPGLGTAESMSAYICYKARVGMPEARRTVVSNIYSGGISAVEAGAYLVDLICKILDKKASGVELQN